MKVKQLTVFLMIAFLSASAYGQSFLFENTMTIFKGDIDKLTDVNDYNEVEIKKTFVMAGVRFDEATNEVRGIRGGFATKLGSTHFGMFYDGYFWDGDSNTTRVGGRQQDGDDQGILMDNSLGFLIGTETVGGIMFNIALQGFGSDEDINDPVTIETRSGFIGIGSMWGKNFGGDNGVFKPEVGFRVLINMNRTITKNGGSTIVNGKGPTLLAFTLSAEYLFAREGDHQTTLSFGDYPLFIFPFTNNGPPEVKVKGGFSNNLYGEIKQVYDLSGALSLGYLAGFNLVISMPNDDLFEFGFLPKLSCGLTYKASDKFTFNTGVRLGSMSPEIVGTENMRDSFGIYYTSFKPTNVESTTWNFLPINGAWGIGLLWHPEDIFTADFSIDSKINTPLARGGFNFNVIFTLNLDGKKTNNAPAREAQEE